ncbi:MAG: SUF system NifU family Fe-S cluster assembly protein [Ignavibacteria bacterium]|nr:SUF system NifU family Fe-S cluster assembly protein [Ignavibacteria bacterium]
MSDLRELYQEVILDHSKHPKNYHKMEDATHKAEGYNPLCGDHFYLYLKVEDGVIKDISFEGAGCAISKASASIMTSIVKGKTIEEAQKIFNNFHSFVTGKVDKTFDPNSLGKLAVFSGVSEFPVRVKCATLAWHTLINALERKSEIASTE